MHEPVNNMLNNDNARVRHKSDSVIPDEFTDDEVSVDKFLLLHKSTPSWAGESQSKAQMGLFSGVSIIIGTVIGSGVFVSPAVILTNTVSPGLFLVIWGVCGVISLMGSLVYAELGTLMPKSGGEYIYFLETYSKLHPFWGPLLPFTYSWVTVLLLRPATTSIAALAFAEYSILPIMTSAGLCDEAYRYSVIRLTAALAVCLITVINCASVKISVLIQNIFTVGKLAAIAVIVLVGIYRMFAYPEVLNIGFANSTTSINQLALAFYGGLWAYDGWNNLNFITGELENPQVNLPRAIWIGISLTTVLYILLNISYLAVLTPIEMMTSKAVAVDWGDKALGPVSFLIPVAVAMSVFGSANGNFFVASRLSYAASRENHLAEILSYVHTRTQTPSPALIFNCGVSLLLILPGDVDSLIELFGFTVWIFYGCAMLALIILRFTKKYEKRPYKVHIAVPVVMLLFSIMLVIGPIIQDPQIQYIYVILFILLGACFYIPFVYQKKCVPGMRTLTYLIQILLEVVPPVK